MKNTVQSGVGFTVGGLIKASLALIVYIYNVEAVAK